jgi:hypothetical protein
VDTLGIKTFCGHAGEWYDTPVHRIQSGGDDAGYAISFDGPAGGPAVARQPKAHRSQGPALPVSLSLEGWTSRLQPIIQLYSTYSVHTIIRIPDESSPFVLPAMSALVNDSHKNLTDDAKDATEGEHRMSLWQGLKLYPKAVLWSICISTCIAMEGYDLCLLGNFCECSFGSLGLPPPFPLTRPRDAFPQFNRKFGVKLADGTFQVPAPWQAGLSNVHASLASQLDPCPSLTLGSQGANVGEIIGLFINGIVSERLGYKYTILVCLIIMACLIAIPVTANSVEALLVYYILAGVPWGIWQTCLFYCPRCVEAQCPHACPFSDNHLRF